MKWKHSALSSDWTLKTTKITTHGLLSTNTTSPLSRLYSGPLFDFITDLFLWGDFYFLQHYLAANLDTESVSVLLLSLHIQDGHRNRPPLLLRGHPQGLCFFLRCMLSFSSSRLFSFHLWLPLSFSYPLCRQIWEPAATKWWSGEPGNGDSRG